MNSVNCANCGAARDNLFCARCGQNSRNYQRALPPVIWDLVRETFELDSRLVRTFGLLLFKPGELALEFTRNRRASYVSPFRLYLFVSLLFFFLLSLTTDIDAELNTQVQIDEQDIVETPAENIAALQALLAPEQAAKVQEMLASPEPTIKKQIILSIAEAADEREQAMDGLRLFIINKFIDIVYNPQKMVDGMLENMPIAMFLLLPVFALLLRLIYYNRHRYYVENLVFATHLHTFAFLVYTALLLLPDQSSNEIVADVADTASSLLFLVLFIYHFTALKRYYGDGFWRTGAKYTLQMGLYFVVLTPAAFVAVLLFTVATV